MAETTTVNGTTPVTTTITTITTLPTTAALPATASAPQSSKIVDLLNTPWKSFLGMNFKWLAAVTIRYGTILGVALLLVLFVSLNFLKLQCGAGRPLFLIKQGKTINVSEVSKDTNVQNVQEIEEMIKVLNDLKKKTEEKK